ncbi:hypothetical protein PPYR_00980 [Photinus pyralis]|uniref:Uncharacterized protein n=1 Tax=Photinus pyralis TaxID=7054 RepID=A0A5N4B3Q9_PHOPY|nr:hypothetical protein PPYR_00980 [Photinus pyralis]
MPNEVLSNPVRHIAHSRFSVSLILLVNYEIGQIEVYSSSNTANLHSNWKYSTYRPKAKFENCYLSELLADDMRLSFLDVSLLSLLDCDLKTVGGDVSTTLFTFLSFR